MSRCKPKPILITNVSCELQSDIEIIQQRIMDNAPHRDKVSVIEAIKKAVYEYAKSVR